VTPRGPLSLPPGGQHWYALGELGHPPQDTFLPSFRAASQFLEELAAETGILPARTVLGGFSQGSMMGYALALGAGRPRPAGVIALSGFFPTVDGLEYDLDPPLPPIAIGHGTSDPIIGVEWGRQAKELLERFPPAASSPSAARAVNPRDAGAARGRSVLDASSPVGSSAAS